MTEQIKEFLFAPFEKVCTIQSDTSGCNIAMINPYRYRGYYYDTEIGMYYLQSRYYDPVVGRFVNADDAAVLQISANSDDTVSLNMISYCHNNPVINTDETGMWLARVICGVTVAAVFGTLAYVVCKVVGKFVYMSKKTTAAITVAFAALGGIIGAALGPSFLLKHAEVKIGRKQKTIWKKPIAYVNKKTWRH